MTRVLLIADTERVQRIFQAMADLGTLQLQIASTLPLGEQELTASSPEFTFVQSRISGFSSDILLRHLDKMLPSGGTLVLLAAESEDASHAKRHGRTSLDLNMTDAFLERSIAALLAGIRLTEPPAQEAPAAKRAPARPKEAPEAGIPAAVGYPPAPHATGKAAASAFEEAMKQAQAGIGAPMPEVEDRIEVGKAGGAAEFRQPHPSASPVDDTAVVRGGNYACETVEEALRKAQQVKRRSPYLFIAPVLLLIAVPIVSYLAGKMAATPQEKGVKPAPAPVPAKPQAAPKRGMATLPEMLEGTRLDAEYGNKHPGWARYVGLRAEYKLFRENNLYRAIQVIPVAGGTISEDLFNRVLRQFGGVESYRVASRSAKDGYVIEECAASGGVALTIYRHKDSSKIKGLVVYYR